MSWRAGVVLSLGAVGLCGCAETTIAAPQPRPAEPPERSADEARPVAPLASGSAASQALVSAPASEAVSLAPLCEAKCDRLVAKCSATAVDTCRLNCTRYDPPTAGCEPQTQSALSCARDATDLTCANVAPESCSANFRELAACSVGITPETPSQAPAPLPEGWERVHDRRYGFSVAMPRGSAESMLGGDPARVVAVASGTTYSVRVFPPLKDMPSEKVLLHALMNVQGRCGDKLKVDGFVAKATGSLIHFSSRCPDDTESDGMVYVGASALVVLGAQAKTAEMAPTEPFFYSLEYDKP
jgi:hypothetical protein